MATEMFGKHRDFGTFGDGASAFLGLGPGRVLSRVCVS